MMKRYVERKKDNGENWLSLQQYKIHLVYILFSNEFT